MKIVCNPEDINIDLVEEGNAPLCRGCGGTCVKDCSRAFGYFHIAGLLQVLEKNYHKSTSQTCDNYTDVTHLLQDGR